MTRMVSYEEGMEFAEAVAMASGWEEEKNLITKEYVVVGTYITQGESEEDCDRIVQETMDNVFLECTIKAMP